MADGEPAAISRGRAPRQVAVEGDFPLDPVLARFHVPQVENPSGREESAGIRFLEDLGQNRAERLAVGGKRDRVETAKAALPSQALYLLARGGVPNSNA